jgi:hypothetical protein
VIGLATLLPVIAGIMAVEIAVFVFQPAERRWRFLPTVTAGFFIVLAWTGFAQGLPVLFVLIALSAALVAHATDLYRRW